MFRVLGARGEGASVQAVLGALGCEGQGFRGSSSVWAWRLREQGLRVWP